MTYIIYVYIFFFTLYLSIFLVLPDRWWVRGLQLHVSEASASAAPSDWSLCVRKQPEPGRSNMEARQVTPRGVSQLCRGERRISGSTEAKIFYPRLKQNFPQDRKKWKLKMKCGHKPVFPHVTDLAPCWVTVPFVVAHRKEGDLLNRLPLTPSTEGRTLQTKVRVADFSIQL